MARNRDTENKSADTEPKVSDVEKSEGSTSPTALNANTNTRAEEVELGQTVDTETGEIIKLNSDKAGDDGNTGGPPPPGTDNSTAELVKVKTTGDFLFHDPFSGTTVDNTDDGGNENGVIKSAMVDAALEDGRLTEI